MLNSFLKAFVSCTVWTSVTITNRCFRICSLFLSFRSVQNHTTMVPTFLDWQISLTFPVYFFDFPVFFSILFNKFNKYKNWFYKYTLNKNQGKNIIKIGQNSLIFSSILSKILSFFQYFGQNSPTFSNLFKIPWLVSFPIFPGYPVFPVHVGNMIIYHFNGQKCQFVKGGIKYCFW